LASEDWGEEVAEGGEVGEVVEGEGGDGSCERQRGELELGRTASVGSDGGDGGDGLLGERRHARREAGEPRERRCRT